MPWIPSMMVPYGIMSDFYFSGHCGWLTINLCEVAFIERNVFRSLLIAGCILYLMFILVIFRVHYTIGRKKLKIDLPIGIAFAFLTYWTILPVSHQLDHAFSAYLWNPYLSKFFSSKSELVVAEQDVTLKLTPTLPTRSTTREPLLTRSESKRGD